MKIQAEQVEKAYNKFKKTLSTKESDIVTSFYGIDKKVRHTLEEIAEQYKVTRERIRQIKSGALKKIKIKK